MKTLLRVLALVCLLFCAEANAQNLNILTNLHPRPKASFLHSGQAPFALSNVTRIVLANNAGTPDLRAAAYLNQLLQAKIGDTLAVTPISSFVGSNGIFIGEPSTFPELKGGLASVTPSAEDLVKSETYVLDVSSTRILLAGSDTNGTFDAVSTLAQLIAGTSSNFTIPALHIYDHPDYPLRWIFSQYNMQVPANVGVLKALEDTMAYLKLNGIQASDFKNNRLESVPAWYFTDVDSIKRHAEATNVEMIPGVCDIGYSEGILFHDPDLAEGIPTTSSYLIQQDTGKLLTDPRIVLPNGGFEQYAGNTFSGYSFQDAPGDRTFADNTVSHSGSRSLRLENMTTGNTRVIAHRSCDPFHSYHLSVWVKTAAFSGSFQILAIGTNEKGVSRTLTFTQYSVPATSGGWVRYDVVFNTLQFDQVNLYAGVWDVASGKMWLDDFAVEDAGLTNVLRRPSEMPTVTVAGKTQQYQEGRDYQTIIDPVMEQAAGNYTWHTPPGFKLAANSSIHNGDTVRVHFIRANPVLNDQSGNGPTMVCVSEDTLYSILQDQITRVNDLHHANRYMMGHDEIRVMNWDTACTSRNLSPADLLADNLRKCDSIIHHTHPGSETFVWSDMFDSTHNAVNQYYLVNGDLRGDWLKIPTDVTIVNWSPAKKTSLNFFAQHGFSQLTSPYYDSHNSQSIRDWRIAMEGVPSIRGMMYTTWAADYSFLRAFADYAWSGGPMIVHTPIDSAYAAQRIDAYDSIKVDAEVFDDPYDTQDSILSVTAIADFNGGSETIALFRTSTNHFTGYLQHIPDAGYTISATSSRGLHQVLPTYIVHSPSITQDVHAVNSTASVRLYPNPAADQLRVDGMPEGAGSVSLVNVLGQVVLQQAYSNGNASIDLKTVEAGAYTCVVNTSRGTITKTLRIVK